MNYFRNANEDNSFQKEVPKALTPITSLPAEESYDPLKSCKIVSACLIMHIKYRLPFTISLFQLMFQFVWKHSILPPANFYISCQPLAGPAHNLDVSKENFVNDNDGILEILK